MLATLALLLGLPLALATQSCSPLVPVTFDSSTIPRVSPALISPSPSASLAFTDTGYGRSTGSSVFISLPVHACFP